MQRRSFIVTAAIASALSQRRALAATGQLRIGVATEADALTPALRPWPGPYGGLPPFDRVTTADIEPAMAQALRLCRAEIDAIAADPAPPDFANTLAALEEAGQPLDRISTFYGVRRSTLQDDAVAALVREMAPRLAAFDDETTQNEALFKRIDFVKQSAALSALAPQQRRLVDVVNRRFRHRGAGLDPAAKARVKAINQRLASLGATFGQNLLAEEQNALVLDSEADLAGLSAELRGSAAEAAVAAGKPGQWSFANTRSAIEPFLAASSRRDLREKAWRMWVGRGDNNDANDNKAVITETLRLREERALLFGLPSHAHWVTEIKMAGTPDAALALMMQVWRPAVARAREEIADMQAVADREGAQVKIEPWDYRFYAEQVRREKYALDQDAIKPYLQLDRIRDAMFWAAGQLYGLTFQRLDHVAVYHPDVTVYSVKRAGIPVGVWYFDPYARAGKDSGAWMSEYRTQQRMHGRVLPIVSNNANFIKARPGEPVLISWDDAITLFHEFGHALHGLDSDVVYPTLAGTSVMGDFSEFPSQLNERWLRTPEVLTRFATHHRTGKPMPAELLQSIERARRFNKGFETTEYLAAAIYDMRIHLAPAHAGIDPARFERETMSAIGCPSEIVMRHRPTQFQHIFSGDGYSAGYYDYLWAQTLAADAAEAFAEAGGFYDKRVAARYLKNVLSVGNTLPPEQAYRAFRGRDPGVEALMRDSGFATAASGR